MNITKCVKSNVHGKLRTEAEWVRIEEEQKEMEEMEEEYTEDDDYDRRYREWRDNGGKWGDVIIW